jgi:putative Holliday junction resolvase
MVMKVVGLDIGEKRIGVAMSDELGCTAQGVTVLERRGSDDDLEAIRDLIVAVKASSVVVGLPKNMDGSLGHSAQKVISFASRLEERIAIPVILWDERWTTSEATRLLIQADLTRKKRRKVVDKVAAALILQGFLDSLDRHDRGGPAE